LWDANGNPIPEATVNPLELSISIEVLTAGQGILPTPLYYLAGEDEARQVWRMGIDGQASQVTFEPAGVTDFDTSPLDGSVAYTSASQLFLVDASGAGRQLLVTAGPDEYLTSPIWSPDGTRLAYGLGGIHIFTSATGEDRLILTNNNSIYAGEFRRYSPLAWSPDGGKISVFIGYYEWGGLGIVSSADGTLLSEFDSAEMLAWSTDSQALFMARVYWIGMYEQQPGLFSIAASPNATVQDLLPDTPVWWPYQGADGRLLYFMGAPTTSDLGASMPVSLYSSLADGLTDSQELRSNLLWLAEGEFPEAIWTTDGTHIVARIAHQASATSEILYISTEDQPFIFLMEAGSGFRWGK